MRQLNDIMLLEAGVGCCVLCFAGRRDSFQVFVA